MATDLDELLDRAERATALPGSTKTLGELIAELEAKLDELDERWPNGEPENDLWESNRRSTVHHEIQNLQWAIEDGDYVDDPRPQLSAIAGGRDDA